MAELEKELKESVAYFEQILSVIPGDRTALEFLCVACLQLGNREKFLVHARNLAEVLVRSNDATGAAELLEKLKDFEEPSAQAIALRLRVLAGPKPVLEFEHPDERYVSALPHVACKAERELLQRLISDGVLTEALVQTALDQLQNPPESGADFLISALLILEKENLTGSADAQAAVADAAHAPPVPLDAFEIIPAYVRKVPEKLAKVRGVIPFAKLADEWAVAVLNPLDETLRKEVAEAMGAKCHFFLALPSGVEKVLERIYEVEESEPAPAAVPSAEPPPIVSVLQEK